MAKEKIQVRMKKTEKGSPDGIKVNTYEEGKTYTMPMDLAKVFINEMKIAEIVKAKNTKVVEIVKTKEAKTKAP